MTAPPDTLPSLWDGCLNARDLGGYRAGEGRSRDGVLLRSDNLCRLTKRGLAAFAAQGIGTIIDVRSVYELEMDPSPFAASETVRYLNLPLQNEDDAEAMGQINTDIALLPMYRVMLSHFGLNIAGIVEAVAEADSAVVIHCHAGKDRTGLVIALLLAVAGVENEAIAADYAASEGNLREAMTARLLHAKPGERAALEAKLGATAETMLGTLEWLQDEYGGVEAYLLRSGVTGETLVALREKLVQTTGWT